MAKEMSSESVECSIKTPKRILHFSDGVLEEYSDEEDTGSDIENNSQMQLVVKSWPLITYIASSVFWFGSQALKVCDYMGEGLANILGITSPKYQYEIDEYNRIVDEDIHLKEKQLSHFSGWTQSDHNKHVISSNDIQQNTKQTDNHFEKEKV